MKKCYVCKTVLFKFNTVQIGKSCMCDDCYIDQILSKCFLSKTEVNKKAFYNYS